MCIYAHFEGIAHLTRMNSMPWIVLLKVGPVDSRHYRHWPHCLHRVSTECCVPQIITTRPRQPRVCSRGKNWCSSTPPSALAAAPTLRKIFFLLRPPLRSPETPRVTAGERWRAEGGSWPGTVWWQHLGTFHLDSYNTYYGTDGEVKHGLNTIFLLYRWPSENWLALIGWRN